MVDDAPHHFRADVAGGELEDPKLPLRHSSILPVRGSLALASINLIETWTTV